MVNFILVCIIIYLFYLHYKDKKTIKKALDQAKKDQEEAIYGRKLPPKKIRKLS